MRTLMPDIRVFVDPMARLGTPRIMVNSGTEQATFDANVPIAYCPRARVPKEDWRTPTVAEDACLMAVSPPTGPGTWISVIRIPDVVMAPLVALGLTSIERDRDLGNLAATDCYRDACATVLRYLARFSIGDAQPILGGVRANPPGLRTATFDAASNCYIGLHVDNWDHLPLDAKAKATNRIGINVGTEDRYFVYINLGLKRMVDHLADVAPDERVIADQGSSIGQTFLRAYPSYPVVKLRVGAGEAYVAPTENLMHDGCTVGKRHLDLHLSVRGHFRAIPAPVEDGAT